MNTLVLVGSTRRGSFNAAAAQAAIEALPADCTVTRFDVTGLPFYDADADAAGELGERVAEFRRLLAEADAVLLASPVYNGSMAAPVKNAIDIASRPREAAAIAGKPVGVISVVANPRAAAVLEHVQFSLRIAGAAPLERGVAVPFADSFEADGHPSAPLREQLNVLIGDLLAAGDGSVATAA